VDTETKALHFLTDEVTAVKNAKSTSDVINIYPILGGHMAGGRSGWIDPKSKKCRERLTSCSVFLSPINSAFKAKDVAEAKTALENNAYNVFLDSVSVFAGDPRSSNQPVGMSLDANSCMYWLKPPSQAPCILYFQPDLRNYGCEGS